MTCWVNQSPGQISAICKRSFGRGIGVICAECISLPKWTVYVNSRARFAQNHQRRFSRWLHNARINVHRLYSPLIQKAIADWDAPVITVIEDTSQLWGQYCLVRLSVQYRGRAVPIVEARSEASE